MVGINCLLLFCTEPSSGNIPTEEKANVPGRVKSMVIIPCPPELTNVSSVGTANELIEEISAGC
jgi:hypothetical protein